jgi:hypothetical protein
VFTAEVLSTDNFLVQHRWVSGLYPSSGIIITGKHNVSETGSISILIGGEGDTCSVGSLRKS